MTEYLIIIEKAEKNYPAYCPDLPGVIATGPTRKENAGFNERGNRVSPGRLKKESLSIPEPTTTAASVDVSV